MDPVGIFAALFSITVLLGSIEVDKHNWKVTECQRASQTAESPLRCTEYRSVGGEISKVVHRLTHAPDNLSKT